MDHNKSKIVAPASESRHYQPSEVRRVVDELGVFVTYPQGVSMRPLIWRGQHYVAVTPLNEEPQVGDILVFEQIRREKCVQIVHRLVAVETVQGTPIYVTRGDNCLNCEVLRREDIIGRVTEIYRNGGWRPWHMVPKRHFTTDDPLYRAYSRAWMKSWPLRRNMFKFRCLLSRIKHRMVRR